MGLGFVVDEPESGGRGRLARLGPGGVTYAGATGVINHFRDIEERSMNWSVVFDRIHKSFLASERSLFRAEGSAGVQWAPDTPKYTARKVAHGYDPRTMRRTTALETALTTGHGPGAVTDIGPEEAAFGTSLHYAVFSQRGSGRRRRRVLVVSRRQRSGWVRMVRDHVTGEEAP